MGLLWLAGGILIIFGALWWKSGRVKGSGPYDGPTGSGFGFNDSWSGDDDSENDDSENDDRCDGDSGDSGDSGGSCDGGSDGGGGGD